MAEAGAEETAKGEPLPAAFLKQLYDTAPCSILQFSVDCPYPILHANRGAREIYGYTQEESRTVPCFALLSVGEKDRPRISELLRTIQGGGRTGYEREILQKDGSRRYIIVSMERLTNADGQDVVQATVNDVTQFYRLQTKQAQEQLVENQFLRAAIHTSYQRVGRCNLTQGTYTCFVDQNYIDHTGDWSDYDALFEETRKKVAPSMLETFDRELNRSAILKKFETGEKEVYQELQRLGDDGAYHWISLHVIRVEGLPVQEGQSEQDIDVLLLFKVLDEQRSEKKQQEELLRDALAGAEAANRAKSDFLSRMSHDIRTPMNAIIGMSLLGQEQIDEKKAVLDCFRKIHSSARYLLSLLNDVLDMSRIESGRMSLHQSEFCLNGLLAEISDSIAPQAESRQISFQISCKAAEEIYYGDELRIHQILINLLSNSLKFTPAGGKILFQIRQKTLSGNKAALEFQVADTGIGMSREFLSRLGSPFEQENPGVARNYVGSGLGLSIVYNLIRLMGGAIEVESQKDRGSRFTVFLPVLLLRKTAGRESFVGAQAGTALRCGGPTGTALPCGATPCGGTESKSETSPMEAASADEEAFLQPRILPGLAGKRLLLVEDNELNMEIIRTLLELSGFITDTAPDGSAAVQKMASHAAGFYDAVLMDIRMPIMDGLEATRQIRKMTEKQGDRIPVIALSANAFEEDKARAREAGINDYVAKPVDLRQLKDCLTRLL